MPNNLHKNVLQTKFSPSWDYCWTQNVIYSLLKMKDYSLFIRHDNNFWYSLKSQYQYNPGMQCVKISAEQTRSLDRHLKPEWNRAILSICDKPLNPDQFNWSFLELSSAVLLSEGVCWCDCVMIMKLGPQKPVSVTEWSPEDFCHHPHSSQWW